MIKKKAPRNKTIILTPSQEKKYAACAITDLQKAAQNYTDKIIWADTMEALAQLPEKIVDLMIVDPPYNLTKNFASTTFRQTDVASYQKWLDTWLQQTCRLLKPHASIYICADWRTSIAIPEVAGRYFLLQNRITWEREKGRAAGNNWKNCLEDIWFFTNNAQYTFNLNAVKIQRAVLAPYRTSGGEPKDWREQNGKKIRLTAPSNVWTDITVPFWSMPENTEHPTQKPEKLLAKLILASSNKGDLVFDPFVGSGSTAVTAKKLGRHYLGIEREQKYVALTMKRLEMAEESSSIQGYEDGIFKSRNSISD